MKKILIMGLIIILSLTGTMRAQDSFSVSVSCIIPAVPGVNAPLLEEETIRKDSSKAITQEVQIQEENKNESPLVIQEEKEIRLAEEKTSPIIVQTLYSR